MVAKRTPKPAEDRDDWSTKGMSAKQLALFASIRKRTRDEGYAPSGETVRRMHSDMSSGSYAHNIDALRKLGYIETIKDAPAVRFGLGVRALKEAWLWQLVDEGLLLVGRKTERQP